MHLPITNNKGGTLDRQQATDAELMLQLKNGIMSAGAMLYERHKQAIYAFCLRMTSDVSSAQDAAQETFLKMLSKVHTVEHGITLRSWLFSTARNEILMVMRRKRTVPMEPLEEAEEVSGPLTPLRVTEDRQMSAIIENAISRLQPVNREAFLLREKEGMSYDEIAAITGASLSAVKSRIFKARSAMNTMLTPYLDSGGL
jgi:RNA polymerase sigma-70 factor (ECF subfamily)